VYQLSMPLILPCLIKCYFIDNLFIQLSSNHIIILYSHNLKTKTMKKIVSIFTALAFIFVIASCTKNPAKVLPKKDGKWNVTYTETTGSKTESGAGTMTFTETGFTLTDNAVPGLAITGTWSYDKTAEKITLTVGGDITVFVVSDMKRDSETWTNTENNSTTVYKLTKP